MAIRNKPSLSVKTDWAVTEAGVMSNSTRVYTPDREVALPLTEPNEGRLELTSETAGQQKPIEGTAKIKPLPATTAA